MASEGRNFENVEFETQNFQTQESETQQKGGGKISTSDIFNIHFKKTPKGDGKFDVSCNYCNQVYKFKQGGGYGTFARHLQTKHPLKVGLSRDQTQISGFATSSNSPQLFHYNEANCRSGLAEMVAIDHLSFSFGEKLGFTRFCQNFVNPSFKSIPRNTLKRNLLKLFKNSKIELITYFQNNNINVSICSDIWSDHWQTHSYMGITCHWVDENYVLQKRILAYRCFDESHNAENICRLIQQILQEYRLVNRIFSISFDNASANTASINELKRICQPNFGGRFFHVRCACHVLNLCVQDGIKSLNSYLDPIRNVISYIWVHPRTAKAWAHFCTSNGQTPKRFSKDVPTRWNSTFKLLNQSFEYKDLLCSFAANYIPQYPIFPTMWNVCSSILNILRIFNDATHTLSSVYKPTSHQFLIEAMNVAGVLMEGINVEEICHAVLEMREKWLRYYQFIPEIFLVTMVFDPRCKFDGLIECLSNYYSLLGLENNEEIDVNIIISKVRTLCNQLYEAYVIAPSSEESFPSMASHSSSSQPMKWGHKFLDQRRKKPRSSSHSELETYLTTVFEFGDDTGLNFEILEWWKRHKETFPTLAIIASQLLAVPASTVAVEQTFSSGGNILDERRSRLAPESLEAQVCLDDWERANMRRQEELIHSSSSDEWVNDGSTTATSDSNEDA